MNVNEKQMRYILTILEEGSISGAARKLFISQPSLSQMLKNVEDELGMPIFDRSSMPLTLTPAGERFTEYLRNMLKLGSDLEESIRELVNEDVGTVILGIPVQRGLTLLPKLVPAFYSIYPKVRLKLVENGSTFLKNRLLSGEIDLAVITTVPDEERLSYRKLKDESVCLICSDKTALAHRFPPGSEISVAEAAEETFVSVAEGHNITEIQKELFAAAGIAPRLLCASSNIQICQRITAEAGAVMLCPDAYLDIDPEVMGSTVVYRIKNAEYRRGCYMCRLKDAYCPKYQEKLADLITEIYAGPGCCGKMLSEDR